MRLLSRLALLEPLLLPISQTTQGEPWRDWFWSQGIGKGNFQTKAEGAAFLVLELAGGGPDPSPVFGSRERLLALSAPSPAPPPPRSPQDVTDWGSF